MENEVEARSARQQLSPWLRAVRQLPQTVFLPRPPFPVEIAQGQDAARSALWVSLLSGSVSVPAAATDASTTTPDRTLQPGLTSEPLEQHNHAHKSAHQRRWRGHDGRWSRRDKRTSTTASATAADSSP